MTTEDDFQAALDARPDDHLTRLVFADWLDERGDPRAEGYRALGVLRLRPVCDLRTGCTRNWYFHCGEGGVELHHPTLATAENRLPRDWFDAILRGGFNSNNWRLWVGYSLERRKVEDAAALAFAKLLPARRRNLSEAEVRS